MSEVLRHAETEADIAACYPVMALLRPHLASAEEFVARVARHDREEGRAAPCCTDRLG